MFKSGDAHPSTDCRCQNLHVKSSSLKTEVEQAPDLDSIEFCRDYLDSDILPSFRSRSSSAVEHVTYRKLNYTAGGSPSVMGLTFMPIHVTA